jgi:hypothetical protein
VEQRLVTPLNDLLTFGQDHLDVAWAAHVRVDSAMSSVRATSLFWCLVDLDVLDDQVSSVKALDIGVGFGVLKESEEEFGGFDWMTGSRDTELFTCRGRMVSNSLRSEFFFQWESMRFQVDTVSSQIRTHGAKREKEALGRFLFAMARGFSFFAHVSHAYPVRFDLYRLHIASWERPLFALTHSPGISPLVVTSGH